MAALTWCVGECRIVCQQLPDLFVFEKNGRQEGVSAAYGGSLGTTVILAGGCNFPGVPAAEGGEKVYYRSIYRLSHPEEKGSKWEFAGNLPEEAANGASVTLEEGVVCLGGKNANGALKTVWLLAENPGDSKVMVRRLPDLPVAMDDMAAATDGKRVYVAGGNSDGQPANRCFVLEGTKASTWKELPAFPGVNRVQPVGFMAQGKFYLLGGFQPPLSGKECIVAVDGVCFDPVTEQWKQLGEIRPDGAKEGCALVGAAGQAWGTDKVVFTGGVNREIFKKAVDNPVLSEKAIKAGRMQEAALLEQEKALYLKHEPGWYHFNPHVLIYDVHTDHWTKEGDFPMLARAGAVMVKYGDSWVVINGEIKPGIRSSEVYMLRFENK